MSQGQNDTIKTRIISTVFTILALAIFKPFGLDTMQWMAYVHLLSMGILGLGCCIVTDGLLKYVIKMPRSYKKGVDYIIRRNLWFQLINTPMVALAICLYRHFVMSDQVPGNVLSWGNFLETLLIITFCSFAIGLYWRFKFRSSYLTAELEETRVLNEQLRNLQQKAEKLALVATTEDKARPEAAPAEPDIPQAPESTPLLSSTVLLKGNTSETVTLHVPDLLYIEAVGNYMRVYQYHDGTVQSSMLRATSKQIEETLGAYPMIVRCHRAFLVNLQQVEQIVSKSGSMQLVIKHCNESLPVSRSNMAQIKAAVGF